MKYEAPFVGFGYFATRPYLWMGPLLAALLSLLSLIGVFTLVAYFYWPETSAGWMQYSWQTVKSLGYASLAVLILWITLFPIIFGIAFEHMCKKIVHEEKGEIKGEGFGKAVLSSVVVIFRTLTWRLFWPLLTLIFLVIFPPLTLILVQIGMGHIALLDGCDLALTVQGASGRERIKLLKSHRGSLLISGCAAGFLSLILTATFIGWLFWLPGIYAGAVLWTMKWKRSNTHF